MEQNMGHRPPRWERRQRRRRLVVLARLLARGARGETGGARDARLEHAVGEEILWRGKFDIFLPASSARLAARGRRGGGR